MKIRASVLVPIVLVLAVVLVGPVLAASPDAPDKETRQAVLTVPQARLPELAVRHELAMLIVGTSLLVLAALVRRST